MSDMSYTVVVLVRLESIPRATGRRQEKHVDRVTGPIEGHYVASSASEVAGRYLGFAKVCCSRPGSFWLATLCEQPGCCAHLCGGGLFDSPEAALASAELLAQAHIRAHRGASRPAADASPQTLSRFLHTAQAN